MEKSIEKLKDLIADGEKIKNGVLNLQKSDRWKMHSVDILRKYISTEEAEKFKNISNFRPPPGPLPHGVTHPLLDENGYVVGRQEKNFKKDINNKLEFLKALSENIEKNPDEWKEKIKLNRIKTDKILEVDGPINKIKLVCNRFQIVERQLSKRHDNRETLKIEDEYDVQDLFHSLLKIFFNDIRPEEWTPSYAGGSSRMDFILKNEKIVVETKKTRHGLKDIRLGEELIIDIEKYKNHPDCKTLFCFVYNPDGLLDNPSAIENDLTRQEEGIDVIVLVTPK